MDILGYKFATHQVLLTLVSVLVYIIIRLVMLKILRKIKVKSSYSVSRFKSIKKIFTLILGILLFTVVMIIWGVESSQILLIASSVLTIFGIAFFAQWSLLSNITASFIIFFNHPIKIDDRICILDKDYDLTGRITDIGIFYLYIKLESGETVTIPTSLFLQKMVKLLDKK